MFHLVTALVAGASEDSAQTSVQALTIQYWLSHTAHRHRKKELKKELKGESEGKIAGA